MTERNICRLPFFQPAYWGSITDGSVICMVIKMKVNGTLMNYYFHCKRQCFLHGNRINLENNSENVKIGKALHEAKLSDGKNTELEIDNIKIDKISPEYLTELKKSDADETASKWQLYYYLYVLKSKGIQRKGKLQFLEKNKQESKTLVLELTPEIEEQLLKHIREIEVLIESDVLPPVLHKKQCSKCAYYEYCYI